MIQHPLLVTIGIVFLIFGGYLEIRYYRAGFPRSRCWLSLLFFCGAAATICLGLAFIPEPIVMFQSLGTCLVLLFVVLLGGGVMIYTVPNAMKEAKKHRKGNGNMD
jgi:hypothetical protein